MNCNNNIVVSSSISNVGLIVSSNSCQTELKVTSNFSNASLTVACGGAQGPAGVGVPEGGTAGQVLAKIDGTDYNTEWIDVSGSGSLSWIDVAGDVEYTGVDTNIASGEVSECDYKGGTIYRFINSTNNANGYSIEDSFYSNFDGTNLTGLIVTRG